MDSLKLFLVVLGAKPAGRMIEQHDVAFVVGENIESTFPVLQKHWSEQLHLDSYMVIDEVDGYCVTISKEEMKSNVKLFFINLGAYKANDLEEYHKKLVIPALSLDEAKQKAKQDPFCLASLQQADTMGHVDDKMELRGFDVDDALAIDDAIQPDFFIALSKDDSAAFKNNKAVPGYRKF